MACRVVARQIQTVGNGGDQLPDLVWSAKSVGLQCVTRTTFEVTLELLRLSKCFERDIDSQSPRCKFHRVITFARIVLGDALFQVRNVSNVSILRMTDAFNNVGVKRHVDLFRLACHP